MLGGVSAVLLGDAARPDGDQVLQPGGPHRLLVAAPTFGGSGCAPAVDVHDPGVAEIEEMAGGEPGAGDVIGTDAVDLPDTDRATLTVGVRLADGVEVGRFHVGPSRMRPSQRSDISSWTRRPRCVRGDPD